ncbi:MAG: succinate dehydrogenase, cytochrome b556 subunit [Alteromonadaceae bacterium]|nr:succinate dehydrogenase, cytochrome b556 subunit [Alteromonadaceae bacterium]MDA0892150.1 succinate dehydrogenase, cytochrome b556 subunit [Pseudomonadota bacterium]RCL48489.1 MAG: succinate dehydrogenase, cytochrome b556 subunit [Halieaceae bacterium]RPH11040.1 MAG: succinate dehydrogenase, cytochrome b556 subunit [Alteromonadaceae bacterium TMED101]CAI8316208.1 MAG: Succinate dehydrogenase cytochrome b556 subunit [Halieaceae bacterium]
MKPRGSKDQRPINLDISTMKLPITAYASISHRVSGVLLFASSILMVWALDASLESEESFDQLAVLLSGSLVKVILWAVLVVLTYHALAGIRHLIMDMGFGEDFEGGALGARILFSVAALAAVIWGVVLW